MSNGWHETAIGDVTEPADRWERPIPGTEYRQIGVRLWGEGAYERDTLDGGDTKYASLNRVEPGDIIVNKIWARNGSVSVVNGRLSGCYCSGEFPLFQPLPDKLEPRWFYWITKTAWFWERCDIQSRGTSGKNRIRPERFLKIGIPLPPLAEQRRIVAKIEQLASKIEEARGLRGRTDQAAEVLWEAAASRVLNGISRHLWRPLGSLVEIGGGGTPSKENPLFWGGDIPWISPKDMKQREIRDSIDQITQTGLDCSRLKLHDPGTVLVVIRGMILAHTFPSAVLRVPGTINQDMKALNPKNELTAEYLCSVLWGLNDSILAQVDRSGHDTRKLVTPKLEAFQIPVPPLPEQRRIVAYLDDLQAKVDQLKTLQAQTAAELDALLPSILDRAFRGEL